LKKERSADLWEGAVLVARYQYPDLNEEKLLKQIQIIKQDVWLELNENLTALEKIKVINHIMFDVHRYGGNTENYHAPENSFINKVLENKKGNPLSLSIIYLLIARQLNLPVFGINLPEHFVLAYIDEYIDPTHDWEERILFYINPFSKGAVFSRKEIDMFLKQLNIGPEKSYYTPCSNVHVVQRLIRNLISAYTRSGNAEKIEELEEIMHVLE
jgi:regulator of sirC expression with transglutaminase-like and TPR domain